MAKVLLALIVVVATIEIACGASLKQAEEEYIAGHVLYRKVAGVIEYILLQKAGELDDWSVPKGHIEAGENPVMGAQRETFEETSFLLEDYSAYYDKEIYFEYTTNDGLLKKVTVFPAKLTNLEKPVEIDPNEHADYVWLPYNAALSIVKKQYREAFIEANSFIVAQEQA